MANKITLPGGAMIDADDYPAYRVEQGVGEDGMLAPVRVVLVHRDGGELVFIGDRAERILTVMKQQLVARLG